MHATGTETLLAHARSQGLLRTRDLERLGIPRVVLTRLVRDGRLHRISRGIYTLPDRTPSEHDPLLEVALRYPKGVFCLLTALRFHELTTQAPFQVWLAIPNKARPPKLDYPPLRVVRMSRAAIAEGVEEHELSGVPVHVFSVAKTVADCFKFRSQVGLDVALEALREAWHGKRVTMDELWRCASVCRVSNVMRPYLESLV